MWNRPNIDHFGPNIGCFDSSSAAMTSATFDQTSAAFDCTRQTPHSKSEQNPDSAVRRRLLSNMGQTSKLDKSLFRRFSIRPNWVRPRKISVLYSLCFSVRAQSRAKSWIFNSIWVLLDVSCGSLLILVGWVLSKTSSWSSSSISSSFSSLYFSRFLITVIYSASSGDFRLFQLNEAIIWKKFLERKKVLCLL